MPNYKRYSSPVPDPDPVTPDNPTGNGRSLWGLVGMIALGVIAVVAILAIVGTVGAIVYYEVVDVGPTPTPFPGVVDGEADELPPPGISTPTLAAPPAGGAAEEEQPPPASPTPEPTVTPFSMPATATAAAETERNERARMAAQEVVDMYPDTCSLLQDGDTIVGSVCFPRVASAPDHIIPVAEGGYSILAIGVGSVDDNVLAPVAEDVGHIVFFPGALPDGTTPEDLNQSVVLSGYIPGAVAVTHVTMETPYDVALAAARDHATGMLNGRPNCGDAGCPFVYFWEWNWGSRSLILIGGAPLTR